MHFVDFKLRLLLLLFFRLFAIAILMNLVRVYMVAVNAHTNNIIYPNNIFRRSMQHSQCFNETIAMQLIERNEEEKKNQPAFHILELNFQRFTALIALAEKWRRVISTHIRL